MEREVLESGREKSVERWREKKGGDRERVRDGQGYSEVISVCWQERQ